MVSKTYFIALCAGLGLALGDAPKPNKPQRAKPMVIDLDFTDDGEHWTAAPGTGAERESGSRWIYWAVGAGVAAAGGVGWYLFQDRQDPTVTRNEQVFTDER
jgi:hypothetical protein